MPTDRDTPAAAVPAAGFPRGGAVIYPQMLLDLEREIAVDLFAGGGGASCGYEMATGRIVDIAIDHDPAAVAMHQVNHPLTRHYVSDVFEVDPRTVTGGRRVGLLWASPDCTYHSKARGAKPIRSKERKRRALAWVVTRWAGQVRPRVIMLENVEEFADWGPLVGQPHAQRPCPKRRGRTFRKWVRSLERLGYVVEWRELRACDYGAPTIRKRLFLIARCDGQPIVWPEPTHGPGRPLPYRTAAECIDWSIPMLSIFATREEARAWAKATGQGVPVRPLAEATQRRVARGVMRYVVNFPEPFIVGVGGRAGGAVPLGLVAPYLVPRYGERPGQEPRTRSIEEPAPVVVPTGNGGSLVAAHLSTYYGGDDTDRRGADIAAWLAKYYGQGVGQKPGEPLHTIPTLDRFGPITVTMQGQPYLLDDIAMRMLQPRELYRAQGFPDSYVIDRGANGRKLTRTEQMRMAGNSVAPPIAAALVRANVPELIARDAAKQTPERRRRPLRRGGSPRAG